MIEKTSLKEKINVEKKAGQRTTSKKVYVRFSVSVVAAAGLSTDGVVRSARR
jgi:hypothetical protein